MGNSDFYTFCTKGTVANGDLLSIEEYASDGQRVAGFQRGLARRALINRVLRQSSHTGAVLARFVADTLDVDVADDGDVQALADNFAVAVTRFTAVGAKGDKGDTGPKGDKGDAGPKGDKGDKGDGLDIAFGDSADTACEGDDPRLSDARTPTAHAESHYKDGADPIDPVKLGLPTSVDPNANTIVMRDADGKIHGNITGTARYA